MQFPAVAAIIQEPRKHLSFTAALSNYGKAGAENERNRDNRRAAAGELRNDNRPRAGEKNARDSPLNACR